MPSVAQIVMDTASAYGVPPALALELAIRESGLNQSARGAAGEIGVMQLRPATAAALGVDPFDLAQNVRGGVLYLRAQLSAFGDAARALAAYNCGPGCVSRAVASYGTDWLRGVPASTRSYVASILGKLGTAWSVAPSLPVPDPARVVARVAEVDPETWKKIALLAAGALGLYFGVRLLSEET